MIGHNWLILQSRILITSRCKLLSNNYYSKNSLILTSDCLVGFCVYLQLYLQLMSAVVWSFTASSCQLSVTPEVLFLLTVNIWSCYPDCKVPPSLQEQTNSISPCQSAALRETNLSTKTNRDRQQEKEMQQDRVREGEETGIDKWRQE